MGRLTRDNRRRTTAATTYARGETNPRINRTSHRSPAVRSESTCRLTKIPYLLPARGRCGALRNSRPPGRKPRLDSSTGHAVVTTRTSAIGSSRSTVTSRRPRRPRRIGIARKVAPTAVLHMAGCTWSRWAVPTRCLSPTAVDIRCDWSCSLGSVVFVTPVAENGRSLPPTPLTAGVLSRVAALVPYASDLAWCVAFRHPSHSRETGGPTTLSHPKTTRLIGAQSLRRHTQVG
jgi:hypothetical protein